MERTDNILYLLNPSANENRASKEWEKISTKYPILPKDPVDVTKIPDLVAYIKERKPDIVAIAGGDGSVNKVCYAVLQLKRKPAIAVFPFGFGNAMAYNMGVDTVDKAVQVITEQKEWITIDLLKTNLKDYPIGTFNISVGFDARVVYHRMNDRYIGFRSYFLSALRSVFFHTDNKMMFTIDNTVQVHATASSLVIANSPIIGLNFVVADYAKLNDAYLDCTIFSTKVAYITNMRLRGFKHPLFTNKGKIQFKAKHIRVDGEPFVQVDGDSAMLDKPLEVEILPEAVTFLANERKNIQISNSPFVEK
jgi:diacylglycerol kinase family enzyme